MLAMMWMMRVIVIVCWDITAIGVNITVNVTVIVIISLPLLLLLLMMIVMLILRLWWWLLLIVVIVVVNKRVGIYTKWICINIPIESTC